MTERNPYRPGVGLQPAFLAGRDDEIARFKRLIAGSPEIPGNVRMSGLRGVGKTVLLQRFREVSEELGWSAISFEIQPRQNSESNLIEALGAHGERLKESTSTAYKARTLARGAATAARKLVRVNYEGFEWSLAGDLEPKTAELGEQLSDLTGFVVERGKNGLVILLDEAQILTDEKGSSGNHALSTLVAAVSTLQKAEVPVVLVLCGLPTLAVNLLNARTYSERMFQGFTVGSLPSVAAEEAFVRPLEKSAISAAPSLVEAVLEEVEGYPYFIQLWGAELWDTAHGAELTLMDESVLEVTRDRVFRRLDSDFYEPRIESLTPAEQDLLLDAARCDYPPLVVGDLNGQSPKSPGNVNVLLGRLVKANIIFRRQKGQYEYTAPGFVDFLQRYSSRQT